MIPSWWQAVLLSLAAWRSFQLLAFDDILNRPRRYITRTPKSWKEGEPSPPSVRYWLTEVLTCPYCAGTWIALAWWGAWQLWAHGTLEVAGAAAIMSGVVAIHKLLSGD